MGVDLAPPKLVCAIACTYIFMGGQGKWPDCSKKERSNLEQCTTQKNLLPHKILFHFHFLFHFQYTEHFRFRLVEVELGMKEVR